MRKNIILIFFFYCSTISLSMGQLGLQLGYGLTFTPSEPNRIIDHFRVNNTWLDMEPKKFNKIQGILLGLRYAGDYAAMSSEYQYGFWNVTGEGTNPDTDETTSHKTSITQAAIGVGLEGLIKKIGIGTSIHWNTISQKINTNISGTQTSRSTHLSQKVSLGLYVKSGSRTTIAIKPFVEIPYGNVNFQFLDNQLNPERANQFSEESYDYKLSGYGVQIIFINR